MPAVLTELQRIRTSGARAVQAFVVDGRDYLAIAQLARDIPGTAPNMNGGDSDTDLLLLRRWDGQYRLSETLPAPGGEDAEFFTIDDRAFLAVASIRTGAGPYRFDTESQIFVWEGDAFVAFQAVQGYAAKQWRYWSVDGRHFLGLAQGVLRPGTESENRDSVVYEWDGSRFVERQRVPSRWAYNWHAFTVGDSFFVALADHLGPSVLYRWDGAQLRPHQTLAAESGRAFASFDDAGESFLVVGCIAAPSSLLRWDGERFDTVQTLDGSGARELAVIRTSGRILVVRVNFILGTPADPLPLLTSYIYEWDGTCLRVVADFPTCGGTDVAVVERGGDLELIVSNSLTPQLRFATDTVRYALTLSEA
jgi:hypothetical protein